MKNINYQLKLYREKSQACLRLSNNNQVLRKWFGEFAELIFNQAVIKLKNVNLKKDVAYMDKMQVQTFFVEITCLYQRETYYYEIEKDLIKYNFPKENFNIAKSLLLQIRMNHNHPSYDDLLTYYFDEFNSFDYLAFDKTIKILIGNNLIQSIVTKDGSQYFDKNPQPHDHIYFKNYRKLVDCSYEISQFFKKLNDKNTSDESNIFYIENQINFGDYSYI